MRCSVYASQRYSLILPLPSSCLRKLHYRTVGDDVLDLARIGLARLSVLQGASAWLEDLDVLKSLR